MITLKEIAAELGVSVSTVSRVVTDKDRVDPEKRKLIKAALKKYNYVPNDSARGLRGMSSRSIGIILPTLASSFYNNIVATAWDVAYENGYTVVTCAGGEREKEVARLLKSKQIGKVICVTALADAGSFYKGLFGENSVVFMDTEAAAPAGVGNISFDALTSAQKLADYLFSLGHRDVLYLAHTNKHKRLEGFLKAAEDRGIKVKAESVFSGISSKKGYEICKEIFGEKNRPTAVLATDNSLAFAAIRAAYDLGLSIPTDLSVAGFDALDETGILRPKLTCIMQKTSQMGEAAANMLISGKCEALTLDFDFIKGHSCQDISSK